MGPVAALLLIVGCSENLASCTELPAPAALYESEAECEGKLETAARGFMGEFPQILAKCVAVDPALEEQEAELVWSIDARGDLLASVRPLANHAAMESRRL